jgi:HEPN domain-containing protein
MIEAMPSEPQQWREALRWLEYADEDIRVAQLLAKEDNLTASAAFHCQQAVEKMAKAVLVALGIRYPKIHDLAELGRLVNNYRPEIGSTIAELSGITDWYVAGRYPAADFMPLPQDVAVALNKMRIMRRAIAALAPTQQ